MTRTIFGVRRETVRHAGWTAFVVLLLTVLFVEPWLQSHHLGSVALGIYALLLPVLVWSIVVDIRNWLERRG